MITHEDIIIKAKASISWIYSNILGKTVEAQLRTANEIVQAREEYVAWVSYLLPIEQALDELEFYKSFPQIQEASLIPEVNLKLVTCELNLRELKRDVASFMELEATPKKAYNNNEYWKLREKLLKVGKEDV